MKNSCIRQRSNARLAILHEDYLEICAGNMLAAMLLAVLIYWTDSKISKKDSNLWIWKSHTDFQEDLMFDKPGMKPPHRTTIKTALDLLEEKKFIYRRKNPKLALDQTKQYLVDQKAVQSAIDALPPIVGKTTLESRNTDNGMSENRQSMSENRQCIVEIPTSNTNDYSTEITVTEITKEGTGAVAPTPSALLKEKVNELLSETDKHKAITAERRAFLEAETLHRLPALPKGAIHHAAVHAADNGGAHSERPLSDGDTGHVGHSGNDAAAPAARAGHGDSAAAPIVAHCASVPASAAPPAMLDTCSGSSSAGGAAHPFAGSGALSSPAATSEPRAPGANASGLLAPGAKQAPLSLRDESPRPLSEKTLRARYEAQFWQIIEDVRKERGLKPPTYGRAWKALRDNAEGVSAFYADAVSDEAIRAGYIAMLESPDTWLHNNFTVMAFFKRLQGLLDGKKAGMNGKSMKRDFSKEFAEEDAQLAATGTDDLSAYGHSGFDIYKGNGPEERKRLSEIGAALPDSYWE